MAEPWGKQRSALQKAAKEAAADRRRMLNLKLDRKFLRRMANHWSRKAKRRKRKQSKAQSVVYDWVAEVRWPMPDCEMLEVFQPSSAQASPVVVLCCATHFTPASDSPSVRHLKRTRLIKANMVAVPACQACLAKKRTELPAFKPGPKPL